MTVRLHNAGTTVVSCNLVGWTPRQRASGRRNVLVTPIAVMPGRSLDVARHLGVSDDVARQILDRSPEVRAFVAKGHLQILGDAPVTPPIAAPVELPAAHVAPVELPAPPAPPAPDVELESVPDEVEEAEESSSSVEVAPTSDEPSMTWTNRQLREYCEANGIDATELKSKTMLLRAIRGETS